ncbi:hypothetical protein FOXG_20660 [Fusarium oxysporum f. sp. lycopersici 4287]|uniref:Uncharacterized protein n=1 Tax=Fusarium oxysporum f. sp. lycopersici (strain 4287 / CBS 123668 / FGSC 9935 / NRRL 34936) TaxID=426428 RepID=A0A0J9VNM5_FUSO4|nr:hypothetical protein FOXG_20660 [Fusarium oxysporum f. sp. lycopersici 4287]KAJ9414163.1 hypothetical protein QL093DRAFT_2106618 [Fusarium oxysporum]KNB12456.1 hypothetical protein FOXG_20660 [Fusarium oxysporum f. sp. lycopersici 4287]
MSHYNGERLSEIGDLTTDLETQRDEATRQGREAQSEREIRAAQDRLRTIQRSSEDLRGELERMSIANTRASTSTRDTRSSFQGQPSSSSRQPHRRTFSPSNTASTSAPRRSREASRTTHSPDIRPSTTLETRLSRQQHQRASKSENLPQGTSSNYGQPTTYQLGTSRVQGLSQATNTRTFSAYQSPEGFQQTVVPRAPSLQTPPVQQQPYYGVYTTSDAAPSVPATSRQDDSTSSGSSESSEDEYADDRVSPYWGSRRQFRDVVASVAARGNAEPAQRQRSHHRKGEGHHPLVTEDPLQIPLMLSREVVAYRERKGQYYQVLQLACLDIWLPQYNINNLGHPARCLHRANNLRRDINFLRVILRVDSIQHTVNQADQRIDIELQEHHRVSGQ